MYIYILNVYKICFLYITVQKCEVSKNFKKIILVLSKSACLTVQRPKRKCIIFFEKKKYIDTENMVLV